MGLGKKGILFLPLPINPFGPKGYTLLGVASREFGADPWGVWHETIGILAFDHELWRLTTK